jgi:hypothetical protein
VKLARLCVSFCPELVNKHGEVNPCFVVIPPTIVSVRRNMSLLVDCCAVRTDSDEFVVA